MNLSAAAWRRAIYTALALFFALQAHQTWRFVRARTQDSSTDVNILCGGSRDPGEAARNDLRRPDISKALLEFERSTNSNNLGSKTDLVSGDLYQYNTQTESICDLCFVRDQKTDVKSPAEQKLYGHSHERENTSASFCGRQFDRALFFFTDCWPSSYSSSIREFYGIHSQTFLVNIPGAKYSHAIYTAYLTGQHATNYEGKPMMGDHLVRSMKRARAGVSASTMPPFPLRYVGPEWSFLAIFGKENYQTFFDAEVRMEKEPLDVNFRHPYPFFFEDEDRRKSWTEFQTVLASRNESMMAHSGVLDHRQHGEHRGLGQAGTKFPFTDRMAEILQEDLKTLRSFIDANPEYLLVLVSDHGVDEFDFSGYKMHGNAENGNEPFVLVYNPRLPAQGPKWIDVVDVAPTLSVLLRGVDIPMNALGIPRVHFGEGPRAQMSEAGALKQSIAQLNKVALARGLWVDQVSIRELLTEPFSAGPLESNASLLPRLRFTAKQLKYDLFASSLQFPLFEIAYHALIASGMLLVIILKFNQSLRWYVAARDYLGISGEIMKGVVVYSSYFIQLMFSWWNWGLAADGGFLWRSMSPALCIVMYRSVHVTPSAADAAGSLSAAAESFLFKNEMLNVLLLGVNAAFPSTISWIDGPGRSIMSMLATIAAAIVLKRHFALFGRSDTRKRSVLVVGNAGLLDKPLVFLSLLFLGWIFSFTSDSGPYVFGFHWAAFVVYLFGLIILPVRALSQSKLHNVILSLGLVLHMVSKDNPSRQFVIWLIVFQYNCLLLPLAESIRLGLAVARDFRTVQCMAMAAQALTAYVINQAFFVFVFGLGEKINFDVHPFSGAIGMNAYDTFKAFSGLLMALHKYGVFVLMCLATAQFGQLHKLPDPRTIARIMAGAPQERSAADGSKKFARDSPAHLRLSNLLLDHVSGTLLLFNVCTALGFYLMYGVITRHHPIEQATCTYLLTSFLGFTHCILSLWMGRDSSQGKVVALPS